MLVDVGSEVWVSSVSVAVTEIDSVSDLEFLTAVASVFVSEASVVFVARVCSRVEVEPELISVVFYDS